MKIKANIIKSRSDPRSHEGADQVRFRQLEAERADLKDLAAEAIECAEGLELQLNEARASATEELRGWVEEAEKLKSQLETVRASSEDMSRRLQSSQNENDVLRDEHDSKTAQLQDLRSQVADITAKYYDILNQLQQSRTVQEENEALRRANRESCLSALGNWMDYYVPDVHDESSFAGPDIFAINIFRATLAEFYDNGGTTDDLDALGPSKKTALLSLFATA